MKAIDGYVSIGCDHAGVQVKDRLIAFLIDNGIKTVDRGTFGTDSVDYPDIAKLVCADVINGAKGILICGTGIGMSMASNKCKGIRASVCTNNFMAEITRRHNDANILCVGARVNTTEEIICMAEIFLSTEFEGGRHAVRVNKIEW